MRSDRLRCHVSNVRGGADTVGDDVTGVARLDCVAASTVARKRAQNSGRARSSAGGRNSSVLSIHFMTNLSKQTLKLIITL